MRRTIHALLALLPFFLVALTLNGCGRSADQDDEDELAIVRPPKGGGGSGGTGGGPVASTMKAIKIEKTGTIEGVVKLEGNPNVGSLTSTLQGDMKKNPNTDHCLKGDAEETSEYTWVVDDELKGLKYVVVFIRPADPNEFFDVSEMAKTAKLVEMNQPHCAFQPHVQVFWPKYIDPASPSTDFNLAPATMQQFVMKNGVPFPHNTQWSKERGGNTGGGNEIIPPGGKLPIKNIRPSYRGPVKVSCSIHPYMTGLIWALDHPFIAVTDASGKFKIPNVPAGVKLKLIAWHEGAGFLEGPAGKEITVEPDKTFKQDFTANAQ